MNLFDTLVVLEDELVRLEPLTDEHYKPLWKVAKDKELWKFTTSNITSKTDLEKYLDAAIRLRNNRTGYPFAIYHKQLEEYVGSSRYANMDSVNKRLEIGWTWYRKDVQGTGMNQRIKFLLLQYAFENLGCIRVELKTGHSNLRSQSAIQKIGAKPEGILRKHSILFDGSFRDTYYFSILDDEWPAVKANLINQIQSRPIS